MTAPERARTVGVPDTLTFDCYGTLVDFDLDRATRGILGDRPRADSVVESDLPKRTRGAACRRGPSRHTPARHGSCRSWAPTFG
jgi:FMN phosphatase YigB (HAD superfamily)